MKMPESQLEKPIYGYLVITVGLIVGIVTAAALGDAPTPATVEPTATRAGDLETSPTVTQTATSDLRRWILGVRTNPTGSGAVVTSVSPLSAAEQAGIEAGDRIIAIDGRQVGWIGDDSVPLHRLVDASPSGVARLLILKRSSSLRTVVVQLQTIGETLGMKS
ncbi:PDZ domain-containing protein [Roseiconus lacunae]|uniref:PDZ domain-containing protein n=1 Tax=Roseiconus lacunae TaxID=2605694 RepID=UPI001E610F21|nr:PDZ domain-containing protein [Roseiconus lacunae]MCD0463462.1 PDZ domain-containing protein [Roseiconus lacunae]